VMMGLGNSNDKNLRLRLFFLKEGVERSVEVHEVGCVDFAEIEKRLEQGEAIIIAPEPAKNIELNRVSYRGVRDFSKKQAAEPWYFTHE